VFAWGVIRVIRAKAGALAQAGKPHHVFRREASRIE
jgi:hypothetical protein